jgi:hypothetical protein
MSDTFKPDWGAIGRLVHEEFLRINSLLAELPSKVVGIAVEETLPPRVVIRIGYDAQHYKTRSQYIDATLGALARLRLEDCDALGNVIMTIQGRLHGRVVDRTEYWLTYELKPEFQKLINTQEMAARKAAI